jgi:ribosomal-protein-alanine N-acetyltransferase
VNKNILINSEKEFKKIKKAIMALDSDCFPQPWKERDWSNIVPGPNLILIDRLPLTGFLLCAVNDIDSQAHLLKIVVEPTSRGCGVGESLLTSSVNLLIERGIKSMFLEVASDNSKAISLYEKLGFKKLILKKKFYSNGSDAYAMSRYC